MEYNEIIKLVRIVSESNLESFELKKGDFEINLKNKDLMVSNCGNVSNVPLFGDSQIISEAESFIDSSGHIESPLVGVFYEASSEDAEPFISVGDRIKKGQVVGIIEAMKLMNEVISNVDGIVEEILVENEQTVEFGQLLVRVKQ